MRCRLMRGFGAALWLGAIIALGAASPAAAAEFTPQQRQAIEAIVHDYLAKHPDVMIDALQAAEDKMKNTAQDKVAAALTGRHHEIYDDPESPVAGNPKGDVSIIEFFDYRCPYCKQVEPSLEALLARDKELRFVYKEFPVLGPASVTAARAALAARKQGKYAAFHRAMMALKGKIDDDAVFAVAKSVGLNVARLKRDMTAPEIDRALKANLDLAEALNISGTPGFVIGDQIVPGAISLDDLTQLIASVRKQQRG
jgi:protein-disulfide isomerase